MWKSTESLFTQKSKLAGFHIGGNFQRWLKYRIDMFDSGQTELNLDLEQLQELTRRTIGHYEFNAESYRTGTADHDVSQNYAALLDAIETEKPFKILDLGCGPGRDLKYLKSLGHIPVGVEGSETFVEVATKLSECDVYHMDFINLDLPKAENDEIFIIPHTKTRNQPSDD